MTMLTAFLIAAALLSGFLNGVGSSGGPILLSALLFSGLPPVSAITTNKLTALVGSIGAIINFSKGRKVDLLAVSPYLAATALGAALGAQLALNISELTLGRIFSILVMLLIVVLAIDHPLRKVAASPRTAARPVTITAISTFSGLYNGLFGPGTLILTTLPLRIFSGFALVDGIALATVLNSVSNLVACIVFGSALFSVFTLDMNILVAIIAANFVGHNVGSRIALHTSDAVLKAIVFTSLLVLFAHLLWKYWLNIT